MLLILPESGGMFEQVHREHNCPEFMVSPEHPMQAGIACLTSRSSHTC
jgi:hypothetical protein